MPLFYRFLFSLGFLMGAFVVSANAVWHGRAFIAEPYIQDAGLSIPSVLQESSFQETGEFFVYSSFFSEGTKINIVSLKTQYSLPVTVVFSADIPKDRLVLLPLSVFDKFKEDEGFFVSIVYQADQRRTNPFLVKQETDLYGFPRVNGVFDGEPLAFEMENHRSVASKENGDPKGVSFPYPDKKDFLADFYHQDKQQIAVNANSKQLLDKDEARIKYSALDMGEQNYFGEGILKNLSDQESWSQEEVFIFLDEYSKALCWRFGYRCTEEKAKATLSEKELNEFVSAATDSENVQKLQAENPFEVPSELDVLWAHETEETEHKIQTLDKTLSENTERNKAQTEIALGLDPKYDTQYTIKESESVLYPEPLIKNNTSLVLSTEESIFLTGIQKLTLSSESNYIQLATYSQVEGIRYAYDTIPQLEPLGYVKSTTKAGKSHYKLVLGPVPKDQLGYLLVFYRSQGFSDAFVLSPYRLS